MRKYTGILIVLLFSSLSYTHARNLTIADTAEVVKMMNNAFYTAESDPKASLELAKKVLATSKEIDFKNGIAGGLISIGYAYFKMGDIKNALKYDLEGLNYSREYKLARLEAGALNRLGMLYLGIGALDKSFECYESEIKIRQALNNKVAVADCYQNMAVNLHKRNFFDEAITYDLKAAAIYDSLKYFENESMVFCNIADIYVHQKEYAKALFCITKALKLNSNATVYSTFGMYYYDIHKDDSALYNYNIALKMFTADSARLNMARILGNIGDIETRQGHYNAAEEHLKTALGIVTELADLEEMGNMENALSAVYAGKNDYKNAYLHHEVAASLKDSLNNEKTTEKLAELGTRFEVKEIEDKNKSLQNENDLQRLKLQRKNILVVGTIAAFAALMAISILLLRQNKLRANQQRTELEQKQLRAQMNPHFIFNCLNSIQHFVVANDVKNANKYLSGFASLMRQTLENSKESAISLSKELAYLDNYLSLEQMRYTDKFTARIICDEKINTAAIKIPPMIIQPFIENAIRHGLCYLQGKKGELLINFFLRDQHLFCEIDDNGIGREQSQKLKMNADIVYESQGMELTRRRLALVSKSHGSEYSITVADKRSTNGEPEGTKVVIKFPLEA